MAKYTFAATISAASLVLLAACGGGESEAPAEDSAAPETVVEVTAPAIEEPGLPRSEAMSGASVFFITPADGATVSNPVDIEFGVEGMDIVPAGTEQQFSGHHHLLIDVELPALDQPIPADANHIHFGDGSTSTQLELEPGTHTLMLLLGDHLHIPHDPPVSSPTITITVE